MKITLVDSEQKEKNIELTDEYFIFQDGMILGLPNKTRGVVKEVVYVVVSPNIDNTLGSLEAKVLYEHEKIK